MYEQDSLSALDAITEAQRIAFAPMLFQTALCLRNAGVLSYLDRSLLVGNVEIMKAAQIEGQ